MATADVPAEVAPSALRRQALHKVMRTSSGALYGIVDTAIDDRLYDILQAEPDLSEVTCLYDGAPAIRYARYAPYLLKLHDGRTSSPRSRTMRTNDLAPVSCSS